MSEAVKTFLQDPAKLVQRPIVATGRGSLFETASTPGKLAARVDLGEHWSAGGNASQLVRVASMVSARGNTAQNWETPSAKIGFKICHAGLSHLDAVRG